MPQFHITGGKYPNSVVVIAPDMDKAVRHYERVLGPWTYARQLDHGEDIQGIAYTLSWMDDTKPMAKSVDFSAEGLARIVREVLKGESFFDTLWPIGAIVAENRRAHSPYVKPKVGVIYESNYPSHAERAARRVGNVHNRDPLFFTHCVIETDANVWWRAWHNSYPDALGYGVDANSAIRDMKQKIRAHAIQTRTEVPNWC